MTTRRLTLGLAALLLAATGCAGSRLSGDNARVAHHQGRPVKSATLKDGQHVMFDAWDSGGPGPDKRARIQGDAVVGYVDGRYRVVRLADVEELRLGMDDSAEVKVAIFTGLVLAVAFVVLYFVLPQLLYY
jgi:hypothetical protein